MKRIVKLFMVLIMAASFMYLGAFYIEAATFESVFESGNLDKNYNPYVTVNGATVKVTNQGTTANILFIKGKKTYKKAFKKTNAYQLSVLTDGKTVYYKKSQIKNL
ncbi:hypothetical protein P261_01634 [Lachnospiraceae bacterium TWA4]|nr:hypothetical protein P261_01634 [Lachnospiraceae bacterium TWA4]